MPGTTFTTPPPPTKKWGAQDPEWLNKNGNEQVKLFGELHVYWKGQFFIFTALPLGIAARSCFSGWSRWLVAEMHLVNLLLSFPGYTWVQIFTIRVFHIVSLLFIMSIAVEEGEEEGVLHLVHCCGCNRAYNNNNTWMYFRFTSARYLPNEENPLPLPWSNWVHLLIIAIHSNRTNPVE